MNKDILLSNIDKLHSTPMGVKRIRKNINLNTEVDTVQYLKEKVLDKNSNIFKKREKLVLQSG